MKISNRAVTIVQEEIREAIISLDNFKEGHDIDDIELALYQLEFAAKRIKLFYAEELAELDSCAAQQIETRAIGSVVKYRTEEIRNNIGD